MLRWLFGSRRGAESAPAAPDASPALDASKSASLGLQQHQAGRLAEAEALYREALAKDPDNVDASHFLGVIALQRGDPAGAIRLISKALSKNASNSAAHNNLGNALAARGDTLESLRAYVEAVALQPEYADALSNLGSAFHSLGKRDKAIRCYERALAIAPGLRAAQAGLKRALGDRSPRGTPSAAQVDADVQFNLGNAHKDQGRLDEGIASFRQALTLEPDFPAAHVNLGSALLQQGRPQEAWLCFRRAIVLEPELADAHFNLGILSYQVGDLRSAKAALTTYLRSRPADRAALLTLSEAYSRSNELDDAAGCLERVLADSPNDAGAHNLLGNLRRNQARHADAMRHYELAILHDDRPVIAYQNLLFCMLCAGTYSAAEIHSRHVEFARRFEQPLLSPQPATATAPDPERRLRVGYVSPEFRLNVVGYYVQPILENHDRAAFEVHCYFTGSNRDDMTGRLASLADHWHDVHALSDEEIASLIRAHRIDVLVDLCGHGPGNRILVFARRPAPVQVSYLDYSATSGLSSIDYRLTTAYCDPVGTAERFYSEKLVRLAGGYWTYNPAMRPPITTLPMKSNGYVTFGSFNLYYRVTSEVLDVWARLLVAIPGSRLAIVSVAAGSTEAALVDRLARAGVARDRLSIYGTLSYEKYNELLGSVDIALAPFPYNGATTVMDCLWNGLPVIAKEGAETFSSRLGCSVLAELGLAELVARDNDDYVRIAVELASALPRLMRLRGSVRQRLDESSFRDFPRFTRGLERAYRSMWKDWCAASAGMPRD